jgi:hypothetical protein
MEMPAVRARCCGHRNQRHDQRQCAQFSDPIANHSGVERIERVERGSMEPLVTTFYWLKRHQSKCNQCGFYGRFGLPIH